MVCVCCVRISRAICSHFGSNSFKLPLNTFNTTVVVAATMAEVPRRQVAAKDAFSRSMKLATRGQMMQWKATVKQLVQVISTNYDAATAVKEHFYCHRHDEPG